MYEVVDVHGGHSGVPVWMTEDHWVELKLLPSPRVSLKALRAVQGLLESLKKTSNERKELSFEGVSDANSETENATTKQGNTEKPNQARE